MRYKVGDKVKVRKDLIEGTDYGGEGVVEEMLEFRGKEVTIQKVMFDREYVILEDRDNWYWTEEMFEPVVRNFEFVERIKENCINDNGVLKNDYGMVKLPERSTANSAGYDFYNPETVVLEPGKIAYVKTGVKVYMKNGEMLMLCNRSSNPKKKGLVLVNGVGIVDADYADNEENEGEIAFAFMNITKEPVVIEAGDKLGQGIFVKYGITDDDAASGERVGGFGSTGV